MWVIYLGTGAALAAVRVFLLVWTNHLTATHQITEATDNLEWLLYPEAGWVADRRIADMHLSGTQFPSLWISATILGSFILATPIVVLGWLRQRRR